MAQLRRKKESLPITTELIKYWEKQGWTYKGLDKKTKDGATTARGRFQWTDKHGVTYKGLLFIHQDGYSSMQIENMCAINNLRNTRKANTPCPAP